MRFQDESTTVRQPSLGEQRARRQALVEEQEREEEEQRGAEIAGRKAETKRKILIGSGVTVGLVGLIATYYTVAKPKEVTAVCTDQNDVVIAEDQKCDPDYVRAQGGTVGSGGFLFLPLFLGGGQYRYNYGGQGGVGSRVSGGSFTAPAGANVTSRSGKSVQRGGFGISGKSSGSGTSGKSGGS